MDIQVKLKITQLYHASKGLYTSTSLYSKTILIIVLFTGDLFLPAGRVFAFYYGLFTKIENSK